MSSMVVVVVAIQAKGKLRVVDLLILFSILLTIFCSVPVFCKVLFTFRTSVKEFRVILRVIKALRCAQGHVKVKQSERDPLYIKHWSLISTTGQACSYAVQCFQIYGRVFMR